MTNELNPQLAVLNENLSSIIRRAEALRELSDVQLVWKPTPKVWSISQVLQHLYLGEKVVLPEFRKAIDQLIFDIAVASGPFKYSLMERMFIKIVSPNPPFKVPVPESMIPIAQADFVSDTLEPFLALQLECRQLYLDANGTDLKAAKATGYEVSAQVRALASETLE